MTEEELIKLLDSIEKNLCGETLSLRMKGIDASQAKRIAEALGKNTSVQCLDLWHNPIGSKGAKALAKMLRVNTTLHTLYLRNNSIGYQAARTLAEALRINHHLRSLDLGENAIGDLGTQLLADALCKNTTLQSLVLWKNGIGGLGIAALANMLEHNKTLLDINLSANLIRDKEVKLFSSAMLKNKGLQSLSLGSNKITDQSAGYLATLLANNTCELQSLDLGNTLITEHGVKELCKALASNSKLFALDLYKNLLGEQGAKALVTLLTTNHTLQSLDLYNSIIGMAAADAFLKLLTKNNTLQFLDLRGYHGAESKIQGEIDSVLKNRRQQLKAMHQKGCEEALQQLDSMTAAVKKAPHQYTSPQLIEKVSPILERGQKHLAGLRYILQEDFSYESLNKRWMMAVCAVNSLVQQLTVVEPLKPNGSTEQSLVPLELKTLHDKKEGSKSSISTSGNEHYRQEIERLRQKIKQLEKEDDHSSSTREQPELQKTSNNPPQTMVVHKHPSAEIKIIHENASKSQPVSWLIDYNELEFGAKIGEGSFGTVYRGSYRYSEVAIKILAKKKYSEAAKLEFNKETEVMSRLRSASIVQFYGFCYTPYCIVMEHMTGSLHTLLHNKQALSWELRITIAIDTACAVYYLHQEKILHRDIKSSNVLISKDNRAKLSDFGLSKIKTETQTINSKAVGTLAWMAPELATKPCSQASDIYSFGVTLWEIASRERPFKLLSGKRRLEIPLLIAQGKRDEIPKDCPPKLANLIASCWDADPQKRPTANEVVLFLKSDKTDMAQLLPRFNSFRQNSQHSLTGNGNVSAGNSTHGFQSNLHSNKAQSGSANSGFQSNLNSGTTSKKC